ncbi:MAG TPA: DUF5916 domain-containing protein [Gemmatimonadaceae bacterium]|nr:DUF5916 domain-containing protein [Gemmatimonadaceae bacterium]
MIWLFRNAIQIATLETRRRFRVAVSSALLCNVYTPVVHAQESLPKESPTPTLASSRTLDAGRVRGRIDVDGVLNETDWTAATAATAFTQLDPKEGRAATQRTEVRVLLGSDAIYVGARMWDDSAALITRRLARRDDEPQSDYFTVYIDPRHDHLTAVGFRVAASGARGDFVVRSNGDQDASWDAVWFAAAVVDSQGWTTELRIPLSELQYSRNVEDGWGIQLERFIFRKQERDVFSFTPKKERAGVDRYAHLALSTSLPRSRGLSLVPYASVARKPEGRSQRMGLDGRVALTSELSLTGALNPDFGQVEVDPAVVNLTAFETFFPEKRPFFVEGADVFAFAQLKAFGQLEDLQPFYSRRIGRSPQVIPSTAEEVEMVVPEQTAIAGAFKLSGRLASGWSVGVLNAIGVEETARFRTGTRDRIQVEPLTNYSVIRAKRELREGETSVGGIATFVNRFDESPATKAALRDRAQLFGLDATHFWQRRSWVFDGYLVGSKVAGTAESLRSTQLSSTHYFQRPDATHVKFDPDRTSLSGIAGAASVTRAAGENWIGSVAFETRSPGFEANDLGFLRRGDVHSLSNYVTYKQDAPRGVLRAWNINAFTGHQWNYGGAVVENGWSLGFGALLSSYWPFGGRITLRPGSLDDELTRGGPIARKPRGIDGVLNFGTDFRQPFALSGGIGLANDRTGGRTRRLDVTLNARPNESARFSIGLNTAHVVSPAQYVTAVPDASETGNFGTSYIFSPLDQRVAGATVRVDWTLTPSLSAQLFAQPLIVAEDYDHSIRLTRSRSFEFAATPSNFAEALDGSTRSLRGNAVVRWEYRPGSTLYLVWQQRRAGSGLTPSLNVARDTRAIFRDVPANVFLLKATYWIGR